MAHLSHCLYGADGSPIAMFLVPQFDVVLGMTKKERDHKLSQENVFCQAMPCGFVELQGHKLYTHKAQATSAANFAIVQRVANEISHGASSGARNITNRNEMDTRGKQIRANGYEGVHETLEFCISSIQEVGGNGSRDIHCGPVLLDLKHSVSATPYSNGESGWSSLALTVRVQKYGLSNTGPDKTHQGQNPIQPTPGDLGEPRTYILKPGVYTSVSFYNCPIMWCPPERFVAAPLSASSSLPVPPSPPTAPAKDDTVKDLPRTAASILAGLDWDASAYTDDESDALRLLITHHKLHKIAGALVDAGVTVKFLLSLPEAPLAEIAAELTESVLQQKKLVRAVAITRRENAESYEAGSSVATDMHESFFDDSASNISSISKGL
jgi:hypothetical protein